MTKSVATATAVPVDLEVGGSRDQIAASGSASFTPDDTPSKAATPRTSLEFEDRPSRLSFVVKTWRKTEERLPAPVTRWSRKAMAWIKGPEAPELHRINPLFEPIQTLPARLVARLPKPVRFCLFVTAFVVWAVLFGVIISDYSLPANLAGYGAPVRLGCTAQLWPNAQSCGVDGRNCLPFDNSAFAFNCPADCAGTQVLNPRAIGNQSIVYRSLVVGGTSNTSDDDALVYRGDSFICGAAIHAGVISNGRGGCGVVSLIGERSGYGSSNRNGISSVGFDSSFPLSFDFNRTETVLSASDKCRDPRWDLLILSTIFTALFALFTSSPATFFAPIFVIIFFQIAMASDPPSYSNYPSLASTTLGRFLPAAFVAALIYRFSIGKTLLNCRAHMEKTILWVGGCWVGALGNYTFEQIPIQRLTSHDLHQQPGAITALIIIVLVLFAIVLYQAWCFRTERRLPRMLGLYAILGTGLLICLGIPKLSLRIHHYILALLLLPGTSMQTRASLLCQGILVGLFINGIARWGFDPILQTAAALRGDAQLGSGVPSIVAAVRGSNITFTWDGILRGYEGVSVIVNDVERYRGVHAGSDGNFTLTRQAAGSPEYFRFGFINYLPFGSVSYSDFTKAGTWFSNGTWSDPMPGRTLY